MFTIEKSSVKIQVHAGKITHRGQSSDENVYLDHLVSINWGIETKMVIIMTIGVNNVI
jgi:hypothetical protein